ncbi:family 48 glycosyltransferase [Melampsora larici-populina 98AG31]|uniref:Family 48 glycosyltransferase n=1 Tax=Melampsora larici-populina (strain 98AG31 / pathotype 3-4-7) TaxID=747676 RepID=F4RPF6_MELLP|nr:family 48 glycosyltransferase [Melampsora larici-populina 98AG31]EGG05518.1 family 48 glycosyltransferase [Melampsora larici-populina 98AG31]
MYCEHLLSIDYVQHLLYDIGLKAEFSPPGSEAKRQISFVAQSLKIEEDQNARVTLLEYLSNFTQSNGTILYRRQKSWPRRFPSYASANGQDITSSSNEKVEKKKSNDIPFYTIGFKSATPEYTLRTRIWASLRAQTSYQTVTGFMNYSKAIKLLYRVENPNILQLYGDNPDKLERTLERMARQTFQFVVSMQRYFEFSKEEVKNTEFLLRAYPDINITQIYSAFIDGHQDNYLKEYLEICNMLGEFEDFYVSNRSPYLSTGAKEFTKFPVAIVGAREYIFSENIGVLGGVATGKEQIFGTLADRSLKKYFGTQLPLDRLLTFYYAHPGFHMNKILIIFAVQGFMFTMVFLGTLNSSLTICKHNSEGQFIVLPDFYNFVPTYDWIKRCIVSIFIVFLMISCHCSCKS